MTGTLFTLEVQPRIPARLARLEELANDLLYSWDRQVRGLYFRMDRTLWEECGHNPKVFLRRVAQERLEEAAQDRVYMVEYNRVLSYYDTYRKEGPHNFVTQHLDPEQDLVAYFCAEFGFHESLPIYSGGLGILAGDHCKAASDLGLPFVAVGMLYRQGYFTQRIDGDGNQLAQYSPTDFADLAIRLATNGQGEEVRVEVELPGRQVMLRVWEARAGHIRLYLLDCDLPENSREDRSITYQLYGGDINTRIQQEIILGIGGVRALRALGCHPTVWHINEGHSAFQILERAREHVAQGMDFASALELVAAGTVFTTHTPVPAGHDIFDHGLMSSYFGNFVRQLGIDMARFLQLGTTPGNGSGFNQTALALRGSRFHNGVSRIHGCVASKMEHYVWPDIPPEENPIGHVTNGVHVPTFLAREWVSLLDMRLGGEWRNKLSTPSYWECIEAIPDHSYWSIRQSLKSELVEDVRQRVELQAQRNGASKAQLEALTRNLNPHATDILTVGFARRFATYKRAALIFADPERLARLLNDPERPVMLLFAGKAHPSDQPGQDLIRQIHAFSRRPEFMGKIILLEDYNLSLARKLVAGVDVWLNNPEYPLEASGTSGQKAGLNGVINLSVLDGWWGEGYDGENGWAINPHGPQFEPGYRDREEGHDLLDILEKQVVPIYYQRNSHGYSKPWVKISKASMKSILPRFNAQRMVMDYVRLYYEPANHQRHRLLGEANDGAPAVGLARWKEKVLKLWPNVRARRIDEVRKEIRAGDTLPIRVAVNLGGLAPEDVMVGCLVGTAGPDGNFRNRQCYALEPTGSTDNGETIYQIELTPELSGLQFYKLRLYPYNPLLSHRFELGRMVWL